MVAAVQVVLHYGNYMNHGTNRGDAWGFDLVILGQLSDVRGKDRCIVVAGDGG